MPRPRRLTSVALTSVAALTLVCYHEAPARHTTSHSSDSVAGLTPQGSLQSLNQDLRVQARRDRFIAEWYGTTRDTLTAVFGQPESILAQQASPTQIERLRDSLFTFVYEGARFIFYNQHGLHVDELMQASVWTPRFMRSSDIHFGMSASDVREFFGDSSRDSTPFTLSATIDSVIGGVKLTFQRDTLARVMWTYGEE